MVDIVPGAGLERFAEPHFSALHVPSGPRQFSLRETPEETNLPLSKNAEAIEGLGKRLLFLRPAIRPLILVKGHQRGMVLKRDPAATNAEDQFTIRQVSNDLLDRPLVLGDAL